MSQKSPLKANQVSMLVAGIVSLLTWTIAPLRYFLQPLLFLNTAIHEMSHAFAALVSGGHVSYIVIHPNTSAETYAAGGNAVLIGSAGYVGAAIAGALLMAGGTKQDHARRSLIALAVILGFGQAFWIRPVGDGLLGFAWMFVIIVGLILMTQRAPKTWLVPAALFIGIQQVISAGQSLVTLVDLSIDSGIQTDASILQRATGIPAVLWACGWVAFSIFAGFLVIRRGWKS